MTRLRGWCRASVFVGVVGLLFDDEGRGALGAGEGGQVANQLSDNHGMRMGLGDVPRCVAFPRHLRVAGDCDLEQVEAASNEMEARLRAGPSGMEVVAVVLWSDQGSVMIVTSMPSESVTQAGIQNALAGFYNGIHSPAQKIVKKSDPRLAFERFAVSGTPAVRYATDVNGAGRAMAYLVFGATRTYMLQFFSPASDAAQLSRLAEPIVATILLPPGGGRGSDPAYQVGSFVGAFIMTGLIGRLLLRRSGLSATNALVAFGVAGGGSAAIGLLTMGRDAALLYPAAAVLWLIADLVRLPPPDEPADS